MKGQKGSRGSPGVCPFQCTSSCIPGAREIFEQAEADSRGVLSIDAMRAMIMRGNRTAKVVEAGQKSVKDLTEREANELYVYMLVKNSVCNEINLLGGPDSECLTS